MWRKQQAVWSAQEVGDGQYCPPAGPRGGRRPGTMLHSRETGSLNASPGSPTDTPYKMVKQGELVLGASEALLPGPNHFDGGGVPVHWDVTGKSACANLSQHASTSGAASTRAPCWAESYSDVLTCQVKHKKTSWPALSLERDKIPPKLQPDIPEASAEFHSLWIWSWARSSEAIPHGDRCSSAPGHPAAN